MKKLQCANVASFAAPLMSLSDTSQLKRTKMSCLILLWHLWQLQVFVPTPFGRRRCRVWSQPWGLLLTVLASTQTWWRWCNLRNGSAWQKYTEGSRPGYSSPPAASCCVRSTGLLAGHNRDPIYRSAWILHPRSICEWFSEERNPLILDQYRPFRLKTLSLLSSFHSPTVGSVEQSQSKAAGGDQADPIKEALDWTTNSLQLKGFSGTKIMMLPSAPPSAL